MIRYLCCKGSNFYCLQIQYCLYFITYFKLTILNQLVIYMPDNIAVTT